MWFAEEALVWRCITIADRGFTIQNSVRLHYCSEVQLLPFTKGKKQLSAIEVDVAVDCQV